MLKREKFTWKWYANCKNEISNILLRVNHTWWNGRLW